MAAAGGHWVKGSFQKAGGGASAKEGEGRYSFTQQRGGPLKQYKAIKGARYLEQDEEGRTVGFVQAKPGQKISLRAAYGDALVGRGDLEPS